jgi:NADPH:quinone reductase-like Zn-dependent oxidoreductase
MRALRLAERGGAERLTVEDVARPAPTIGDVLVEVHAASFTPTELEWPSTWVDRAGRNRRPVIPAHELSGVVVAVGYGTTGFAIGDAVYGLTDWYRDGAAADYVAVEARNLAPKPARLDHAAAAAVPLAALTAFQALFEHGGLTSGKTVLILGASGGVGTLAVQLARAAGARVVAAARAWARDLVNDLGADLFVDVDRSPLADAIRDVDLIIDLVGGSALARSLSVLKPGGTLVSVVEQPPAAADGRDRRALFFVVEPNRAQLIEISHMIAAGTLRPIVGASFALSDGRAAFEAKHRPGIPGKIVLRIVDGHAG